MQPDVSVHVDEEVRVEAPLVIVGAPTAGLVGAIAAQFVVKTLDVPLVGGVHSAAFPPFAGVRDGTPSFPVRVYAKEMACGMDNRCKTLVVIETEFVPGRSLVVPHHATGKEAAQIAKARTTGHEALLGAGTGVYEGRRVLSAFSDAVTGWARARASGLLVVPDSVPQAALASANASEDDVPVFSIASSTSARDAGTLTGAQPARAGTVVGLTATLLLSALRSRVDALALVSPSRPDAPDARAAARVVEALDKLIPEIDIETQPLLKEAEKIEAQVREHQKEMQEQARQTAGDTPMYL